MKARCDQCNKEFPVELKEKDHGHGIIEAYFNCSYCLAHYTSYLTDERIRKQQGKVRKMWTDINELTHPLLINKKVKSVRLLEENTKRLMEELRRQRGFC